MPIWSPALFGSGAASGYIVTDSVMFDGSSDYFTQTFSGSGNRNTYTRSFWIKRAKLGAQQRIFDTGPDGGNNVESLYFNSDDTLQWVINDSNAVKYNYATTQVFRDTTAWQHIVCARDTATLKMYVNNVEITDFSTSTNTGASNVGRWTHTDQNVIGRYFLNASDFLGAYLAEVVQIDGQILTPTSFGEFNDKGVWVPVDPSELTFGTNGFYLKFDEANLLGKSSNSSTNPTSSFLGSYVSGSTATVFTTASDSTLGAAASNRSILIAVGGARSSAGARTVNTVTIGGSISATRVVRSTAPDNVLEFWSASVPTGTTGAIEATFNSSMEGVGIAWWRVLDLGSPISTAVSTADGWSSTSLTTIGQTGDIAFYANYDSGDADSWSWSDATERAEHIDIRSTQSFTCADYTFTSSESHAETLTASGGTGNDNTFAAVTFSNNNTFTANSLAAANQFTDTCTDSADDDIGNYCTWNPICAFPSSNVTLGDGNTKATITPDGAIIGNQFFDVTDSDGFYWETKFISNVSNAEHVGIGQQTVPLNNTSYLNNGIATYLSDGGADHTSSDRHSGGSFPTYTDNDTISVAVKGGAIWFAKNNTWINSATASEIAAGTTTNAVFTGLTGMWTPMVRGHSGSATVSTTNWGATSFAYTPPTGLKRLMTADRSAPTVTDPSAFFQNVLYDGTGSTQSITLGGNSDMQPDFVWIKRRNVTGTNHMIFDSVRGATKFIGSDRTTAETTVADTLTSFDSDGFSLGADASGYGVNVSTSSSKYVAWCWKAGGSSSSNSDGDIASTVSVASHGGFSIVKYDPGSGGSPGDTVGHGLSRAPNYIILKVLEAVGDANWSVGSDDIGWTNNLFLNLTNAKSAGSGPWNNTAPTSSVFSIGSDRDNDAAYIAYCFAKTPGLIACGTYTGNGSADGPFVQVNDGGSGFKPAWIMVKRTDSTEGWHINDAARDPFNPLDLQLQPNSNGTESGSSYMDFTANGFKLRGTQGATNTSGGTYVYLAMAENPFGGSGVAQAKAR